MDRSTRREPGSLVLKLLSATLCAVLFTSAAATVAAADALNVAQVEKVTGLSGLSVRAAKYDKAARVFVTAKDEMVVSLKQANAEIYEVWKTKPSFSDQAPLAGIGDDAISSKKGRYVCFKKGGQGACVTAMAALVGTPAAANDAQVLELARLAAAAL
jgi:hypothetical protein